MINVGQYVKAILADGLAVLVPASEGHEPDMERLGIVVQIRPSDKTLVVEDIFGNEHVCHLNAVVQADLCEADEFIRDWAAKRSAELTVKTA